MADGQVGNGEYGEDGNPRGNGDLKGSVETVGSSGSPGHGVSLGDGGTIKNGAAIQDGKLTSDNRPSGSNESLGDSEPAKNKAATENGEHRANDQVPAKDELEGNRETRETNADSSETGGGRSITATRRKWHIREAAEIIIKQQRTISFWQRPWSFRNMCATCKALDLDIEKFIIQDHSSDRSQQAYRSSLPPARSQRSSGFPLGSGSGKHSLGTLNAIRTRGSKCPFCILVIQSLDDFQYYGADPHTQGHAICYASWQVDGREVVRDQTGHVTSSRPRTRRIQLHWDNDIFQDSYLVLVAPEGTRRFGSGGLNFWESNTIFLGREIGGAGNNQALVKKWLDICHTSHGPLCQIARGPEFSEMVSKAYFGVVDVGEMRLTSLPKEARYVALSYMWGEGDRYVTNLDNIHLHQTYGGLEKVFDKLPRVIKDAIRLVRSLGERYIWIDSLCIVQNSDRSWKLNSSVMDLVYGSAHLTICAADGSSAEAGLRGLSPKERVISQHTEECAENLRLMVSHLAETYVKRSHWNTRAWTFQERLLSKRCLIFTGGRVYFQCRSAGMSEDIASGPTDAVWSIELVQAPLQMLHDLSTRAFWVYTECVRLYTARTLGRPSDILAAFNGMSNLLAKKIGSPLIFGIPSSHFDLALLWEPQRGSERRLPKDKKEQKEFQDMQFPSWSWCGWRGVTLEYKKATVAGCLPHVHQWLTEHTWISWYLRDGHGNLRPVWDCSKQIEQEPHMEGRWKGYGKTGSHDHIGGDPYGRVLPQEMLQLSRSDFYRTLPEYPYRVSIAKANSEPDKQFPDQRFLQFWTWSAYLRVIPHAQSPRTKLGEGLARYDIADYTGDWCGTIVLDLSWGQKQKAGSEHEFLAISDAKDFTEEENDVWTYYIPKEKDQSEWDLYYVLLVRRNKGGLASRVGLGKVFKEAFKNSCLPGTEWKEIILE